MGGSAEWNLLEEWFLMTPLLKFTYYIDVPLVPSEEEKKILKIFYSWHNFILSSYLLLFKILLQVTINDASTLRL